MAWWDGRLAAFDVESTGVNPESDRIVTAHIAVVGAGREPVLYDWLLNPGVEIPEGASAVHGITTEQAKAEGMDAAEGVRLIAETLAALESQELPLVIYNAPFDLTMLDRECRRHGVMSVLNGDFQVIDPLVIDKATDRYRRGSRKLMDVCAFHGIALSEEDAHSASADALAAARLAYRLCKRHNFTDLDELMEAQAAWAAEQASGLADYFERQGKHEAAADCRARAWPLTPFKEAVT